MMSIYNSVLSFLTALFPMFVSALVVLYHFWLPFFPILRYLGFWSQLLRSRYLRIKNIYARLDNEDPEKTEWGTEELTVRPPLFVKFIDVKNFIFGECTRVRSEYPRLYRNFWKIMVLISVLSELTDFDGVAPLPLKVRLYRARDNFLENFRRQFDCFSLNGDQTQFDEWSYVDRLFTFELNSKLSEFTYFVFHKRTLASIDIVRPFGMEIAQDWKIQHVGPTLVISELGDITFFNVADPKYAASFWRRWREVLDYAEFPRLRRWHDFFDVITHDVEIARRLSAPLARLGAELSLSWARFEPHNPFSPGLRNRHQHWSSAEPLGAIITHMDSLDPIDIYEFNPEVSLLENLAVLPEFGGYARFDELPIISDRITIKDTHGHLRKIYDYFFRPKKDPVYVPPFSLVSEAQSSKRTKSVVPQAHAELADLRVTAKNGIFSKIVLAPDRKLEEKEVSPLTILFARPNLLFVPRVGRHDQLFLPQLPVVKHSKSVLEYLRFVMRNVEMWRSPKKFFPKVEDFQRTRKRFLHKVPQMRWENVDFTHGFESETFLRAYELSKLDPLEYAAFKAYELGYTNWAEYTRLQNGLKQRRFGIVRLRNTEMVYREEVSDWSWYQNCLAQVLEYAKYFNIQFGHLIASWDYKSRNAKQRALFERLEDWKYVKGNAHYVHELALWVEQLLAMGYPDPDLIDTDGRYLSGCDEPNYAAMVNWVTRGGRAAFDFITAATKTEWFHTGQDGAFTGFAAPNLGGEKVRVLWEVSNYEPLTYARIEYWSRIDGVDNAEFWVEALPYWFGVAIIFACLWDFYTATPSYIPNYVVYNQRDDELDDEVQQEEGVDSMMWLPWLLVSAFFVYFNPGFFVYDHYKYHNLMSTLEPFINFRPRYNPIPWWWPERFLYHGKWMPDFLKVPKYKEEKSYNSLWISISTHQALVDAMSVYLRNPRWYRNDALLPVFTSDYTPEWKKVKSWFRTADEIPVADGRNHLDSLKHFFSQGVKAFGQNTANVVSLFFHSNDERKRFTAGQRFVDFMWNVEAHLEVDRARATEKILKDLKRKVRAIKTRALDREQLRWNVRQLYNHMHFAGPQRELTLKQQRDVYLREAYFKDPFYTTEEQRWVMEYMRHKPLIAKARLRSQAEVDEEIRRHYRSSYFPKVKENPYMSFLPVGIIKDSRKLGRWVPRPMKAIDEITALLVPDYRGQRSERHNVSYLEMLGARWEDSQLSPFTLTDHNMSQEGRPRFHLMASLHAQLYNVVDAVCLFVLNWDLAEAYYRTVVYEWYAKGTQLYQNYLRKYNNSVWAMYLTAWPGVPCFDVPNWDVRDIGIGLNNLKIGHNPPFLEVGGPRYSLVETYEDRLMGLDTMGQYMTEPYPFEVIEGEEYGQTMRCPAYEEEGITGIMGWEDPAFRWYKGQLADIARYTPWVGPVGVAVGDAWVPSPIGPVRSRYLEHATHVSEWLGSGMTQVIPENSGARALDRREATNLSYSTHQALPSRFNHLLDESFFPDQPAFAQFWIDAFGFRHWQSLQSSLAAQYETINLGSTARFISYFKFLPEHWQHFVFELHNTYSREFYAKFLGSEVREAEHVEPERYKLNWFPLGSLTHKQHMAEWVGFNNAIARAIAIAPEAWRAQSLKAEQESHWDYNFNASVIAHKVQETSFILRGDPLTYWLKLNFDPTRDGLGGFTKSLHHVGSSYNLDEFQELRMRKWRDYYIGQALNKGIVDFKFLPMGPEFGDFARENLVWIKDFVATFSSSIVVGKLYELVLSLVGNLGLNDFMVYRIWEQRQRDFCAVIRNVVNAYIWTNYKEQAQNHLTSHFFGLPRETIFSNYEPRQLAVADVMFTLSQPQFFRGPRVYEINFEKYLMRSAPWFKDYAAQFVDYEMEEWATPVDELVRYLGEFPALPQRFSVYTMQYQWSIFSYLPNKKLSGPVANLDFVQAYAERFGLWFEEMLVSYFNLARGAYSSPALALFSLNPQRVFNLNWFQTCLNYPYHLERTQGFEKPAWTFLNGYLRLDDRLVSSNMRLIDFSFNMAPILVSELMACAALPWVANAYVYEIDDWELQINSIPKAALYYLNRFATADPLPRLYESAYIYKLPALDDPEDEILLESYGAGPPARMWNEYENFLIPGQGERAPLVHDTRNRFDSIDEDYDYRGTVEKVSEMAPDYPLFLDFEEESPADGLPKSGLYGLSRDKEGWGWMQGLVEGKESFYPFPYSAEELDYGDWIDMMQLPLYWQHHLGEFLAFDEETDTSVILGEECDVDLDGMDLAVAMMEAYENYRLETNPDALAHRQEVLRDIAYGRQALEDWFAIQLGLLLENDWWVNTHETDFPSQTQICEHLMENFPEYVATLEALTTSTFYNELPTQYYLRGGAGLDYAETPAKFSALEKYRKGAAFFRSPNGYVMYLNDKSYIHEAVLRYYGWKNSLERLNAYGRMNMPYLKKWHEAEFLMDPVDLQTFFVYWTHLMTPQEQANFARVLKDDQYWTEMVGDVEANFRFRKDFWEREDSLAAAIAVEDHMDAFEVHMHRFQQNNFVPVILKEKLPFVPFISGYEKSSKLLNSLIVPCDSSLFRLENMFTKHRYAFPTGDRDTPIGAAGSSPNAGDAGKPKSLLERLQALVNYSTRNAADERRRYAKQVINKHHDMYFSPGNTYEMYLEGKCARPVTSPLPMFKEFIEPVKVETPFYRARWLWEPSNPVYSFYSFYVSAADVWRIAPEISQGYAAIYEEAYGLNEGGAARLLKKPDRILTIQEAAALAAHLPRTILNQSSLLELGRSAHAQRSFDRFCHHGIQTWQKTNWKMLSRWDFWYYGWHAIDLYKMEQIRFGEQLYYARTEDESPKGPFFDPTALPATLPPFAYRVARSPRKYMDIPLFSDPRAVAWYNTLGHDYYPVRPQEPLFNREFGLYSPPGFKSGVKESFYTTYYKKFQQICYGALRPHTWFQSAAPNWYEESNWVKRDAIFETSVYFTNDFGKNHAAWNNRDLKLRRQQFEAGFARLVDMRDVYAMSPSNEYLERCFLQRKREARRDASLVPTSVLARLKIKCYDYVVSETKRGATYISSQLNAISSYLLNSVQVHVFGYDNRKINFYKGADRADSRFQMREFFRHLDGMPIRELLFIPNYYEYEMRWETDVEQHILGLFDGYWALMQPAHIDDRRVEILHRRALPLPWSKTSWPTRYVAVADADIDTDLFVRLAIQNCANTIAKGRFAGELDKQLWEFHLRTGDRLFTRNFDLDPMRDWFGFPILYEPDDPSMKKAPLPENVTERFKAFQFRELLFLQALESNALICRHLPTHEKMEYWKVLDDQERLLAERGF